MFFIVDSTTPHTRPLLIVESLFYITIYNCICCRSWVLKAMFLCRALLNIYEEEVEEEGQVKWVIWVRVWKLKLPALTHASCTWLTRVESFFFFFAKPRWTDSACIIREKGGMGWLKAGEGEGSMPARNCGFFFFLISYFFFFLILPDPESQNPRQDRRLLLCLLPSSLFFLLSSPSSRFKSLEANETLLS